MPKVTLTDIQSGAGVKDTYNANNDTLEQAFDNTLSRDGSSPNSMSSNLDMNSNRVVNLENGSSNKDAVNLEQMNSAITAAGSGLAAFPDSSNVTYTPSGTGAVDSNVQSKLRENVSVKDFGATGNGITDDTDAIKAALLAVQTAGGGSVDFGDSTNTYLILQDSGVSIDTGNGVHGYTAMGDFSSLASVEIKSSGAILSIGRDYSTSERDVIFRFDSCKNVKVGTFKCVYTGTRPTTTGEGGWLVSLKDSNENVQIDDQFAEDWSIVVGDYATSRDLSSRYSSRHFTINAKDTGYPYITDNGGQGLRCSIYADTCGRACVLQDIEDAVVYVEEFNPTASNSVGLSGTVKDVHVRYKNTKTTDTGSRCISINYPTEYNTDITGYSGTHTGGTSTTTLTDSGASFPTSGTGLVGYTIRNTVDNSWGVITSNTSTTAVVSGGLKGGTNNDWRASPSQTYTIGKSHEMDNVSISCYGEFFDGAYRNEFLYVGLGVGTTTEEPDPGYKITNLSLSCTVKSDDAVNQGSLKIVNPDSWTSGDNFYNLRIHDCYIEGTVLPNLDCEGLNDVCNISNVVCDSKLQYNSNTTSKTTVLNSKVPAVSANTSDTSNVSMISCDLTDFASTQSVINKQFSSCRIDGSDDHDSQRARGQQLQSFTLVVVNTAGTLQHKIIVNPAIDSVPTYSGSITGASSTLANTPTVGGGTDFTSGVGLTGNQLVFDTADQVSINELMLSSVEYYDGNVSRPRCYAFFNSMDVNGETLNRLHVRLTDDMTGAAWNVDTTNIPTGKQLAIGFLGYLK